MKAHLQQRFLPEQEKDIPASPFNIRYSPKLSKSETEKEAQKGILNDLTIEILSLFKQRKKTTIGERPTGSDIAVLCNTNPQADEVYKILNKFEIPCVLQASRSIFLRQKHFIFNL